MATEMEKERNTNDVNQNESKTFNKLLKTVNRSLLECKNSIDTRAAVEECYGNDTAIFGDKNSATDMLANLIDGSIERINDLVKTDIDDIFRKEKVEFKLYVLDKVIEEYWHRDQMQKNAEEDDRKSVQDALQRSKLPDGVTVDELLEFQAYKIKLQARDDLQAKIDNVEKENQKLVEEIEEVTSKFQERVIPIDEKAKTLGITANLCSFNGVS